MFLNLLGRLSDSGTQTASVSGHMLTHSRLVFDRETGKPRGYGFCEFSGVFSHASPQTPSIHTTQTMKQLHQLYGTSTMSTLEDDPCA